MKNQKVKTVFLTGATGLIGKNILKHLVENNFNILFNSRNNENIKEIHSAYKKYENVIRGTNVDLLDDNLLNKLDLFFENVGVYPDALINNARDANNLVIEDSCEISSSKWIGEFSIGVIVPYKLSMYLSKHKKSNLKKVINISSIYGVVAPNTNIYDNPEKESAINYGTVKSALIHLTKELAVKLANKNIQVNAVSYGGVGGRVSDDFYNRYSQLNPQNRMLSEGELGGVIEFLLSSASDGMTGQNLLYDGGWTIW